MKTSKRISLYVLVVISFLNLVGYLYFRISLNVQLSDASEFVIKHKQNKLFIVSSYNDLYKNSNNEYVKILLNDGYNSTKKQNGYLAYDLTTKYKQIREDQIGLNTITTTISIPIRGNIINIDKQYNTAPNKNLPPFYSGIYVYDKYYFNSVEQTSPTTVQISDLQHCYYQITSSAEFYELNKEYSLIVFKGNTSNVNFTIQYSCDSNIAYLFSIF